VSEVEDGVEGHSTVQVAEGLGPMTRMRRLTHKFNANPPTSTIPPCQPNQCFCIPCLWCLVPAYLPTQALDPIPLTHLGMPLPQPPPPLRLRHTEHLAPCIPLPAVSPTSAAMPSFHPPSPSSLRHASVATPTDCAIFESISSAYTPRAACWP